MDAWRQLVARAERHTNPGFVMDWLRRFVTEPHERLPYLFICGPQSSGKSILIEALSILAFPVRIDQVVKGKSFNGELIGKNLAIVEEHLDEKSKMRLRHIYTSETLVIHQAMKYPRTVNNQLRFVQESNDILDFPGINPHLIVQTDRIEKDEFVSAKDLLGRLERESHDLRDYFGVVT